MPQCWGVQVSPLASLKFLSFIKTGPKRATRSRPNRRGLPAIDGIKGTNGGTDLLPGRQRGRPAKQRVAFDLVRKQALLQASVLGFHGEFLSLRHRPVARMLILFRVLQGAAGGRLQPVAQAILKDTFPPEHLRTAFAVYGMVAVMGPGIGPRVGGWITDITTGAGSST